MAKLVLTDAYVTLAGVDISDHVRAVTLTREVDAIEASCMGSASRSFVVGADSWSGSITFAEDFAGVTGSVNDGAPTTTDFDGDAGLSASDDAYNGYLLLFTSGDQVNVSRVISDYNGTTKNLTVAAFPSAPANSDTFEIASETNGILNAIFAGAAAVAVAIRPTSSAISATNPEFQGNIIVSSMPQLDGDWGSLAETGISFQGTATLTRDITP